MRFVSNPSLVVSVCGGVLGTLLLSSVLVGCGGRTKENGPETEATSETTDMCVTHPALCGGEYWTEDSSDPDDDDPSMPDDQEPALATGGSGTMEEQDEGMAGALNEPEPLLPHFFRLEARGVDVNRGVTGPIDYYAAVTLPENTLVEARLDDVEMRTGVAGSLTFLLEACRAAENDTELCQLTITTFGGGPSGSPEVDAPLDLRLGGYACQMNYLTSAVRTGDSWSASVQPTDLLLNVQRWEGAVIESRYEDGELVFTSVEQETRHDYSLRISQIEASCTEQSCDIILLAGSD